MNRWISLASMPNWRRRARAVIARRVGRCDHDRWLGAEQQAVECELSAGVRNGEKAIDQAAISDLAERLSL